MTAIPGWAYILIGLLMSVFSKIIEAKSKKPGTFALFFWLGIIFIVIGICKYGYKAIFKKEKQEPNQHPIPQTISPQQHSIHHQAHQQAHPYQQPMPSSNFSQGQHEIHRVNPQRAQSPMSQAPQAVHLSIIACPLCGTRHYDYAKFCMRCGTRIKKR